MNSARFTRLVATGLLALTGLLVTPLRAHAVLGVGDTVFDPTMYATQLLQLEQATATVTNLAQQLQYAVQNTTGGSAGIWQSNQTLLTNLGSLISQQEGLSYTVQGLSQQFQQLYPRLQHREHRRRAESAGHRRNDAQHPQRRARVGADSGQQLLDRTGRNAKP